jgi:predicted nucleic-acid-binding Zn-ribbon protein
MAHFRPQCPKCKQTMAVGHVPDMGYGVVAQTNWAPGEPVVRRFLGGIEHQKDQMMPLLAYRCPSCGFVELYARAE